MLSRAVSTLKLIKPSRQLQQVRNSGNEVWRYRTVTTEQTNLIKYGVEIVGGFAWWWVLWHLYTEPGHIFGEFEYPDPLKWTDQELGIPTED